MYFFWGNLEQEKILSRGARDNRGPSTILVRSKLSKLLGRIDFPRAYGCRHFGETLLPSFFPSCCCFYDFSQRSFAFSIIICHVVVNGKYSTDSFTLESINLYLNKASLNADTPKLGGFSCNGKVRRL